ncbi:hypothetical protein GGR56DRAFT_661926 [Xylariaceae sp. FL0804]|nr:hypothetical protein GGR56DRAFT_661926 [Xylariaceae sp. FL0804]
MDFEHEAELTTAALPPPVNPNDPGVGRLMIGIMWTFTILATIFVALRLYVRVAILKYIAWDDWFMVLAGLLQLAYQSCLTESYQWGLGMASQNMTYYPQIVHTLKWNLIASMVGFSVAIWARISITIFLIRIFGSKTWFKWYLIVWTFIQSLLSLATELVYCLQVSPIQGFWYPLSPARRLNPVIAKVLWMTGQTFFTVADLSYVVLPVIFIWKLNMPRGRKIRLAIIISMSIFTAVASIFKTVEVKESVGQASAMESVGKMFIWSVLEQTFVIIMGCLPTLPKLFTDDTMFSRLVKYPLRYFPTKGSRDSDPDSSDRKGYHNLDQLNAVKLGLHPPPSTEPEYMMPGRVVACSNKAGYEGKPGETSRTDQFTLAY